MSKMKPSSIESLESGNNKRTKRNSDVVLHFLRLLASEQLSLETSVGGYKCKNCAGTVKPAFHPKNRLPYMKGSTCSCMLYAEMVVARNLRPATECTWLVRFLDGFVTEDGTWEVHASCSRYRSKNLCDCCKLPIRIGPDEDPEDDDDDEVITRVCTKA